MKSRSSWRVTAPTQASPARHPFVNRYDTRNYPPTYSVSTNSRIIYILQIPELRRILRSIGGNTVRARTCLMVCSPALTSHWFPNCSHPLDGTRHRHGMPLGRPWLRRISFPECFHDPRVTFQGDRRFRLASQAGSGDRRIVVRSRAGWAPFHSGLRGGQVRAPLRSLLHPFRQGPRRNLPRGSTRGGATTGCP